MSFVYFLFLKTKSKKQFRKTAFCGLFGGKVFVQNFTAKQNQDNSGGNFQISGRNFFETAVKLKAIYDQINQLEKSKVEVTEHVTYHEQYLLWALAGLLLLFAEFLFANLVLKRIP